jgi:O-antigen ligase
MAVLTQDTKIKIYTTLMLLLALGIPLHKTFSSVVILLLGLFWLTESSPAVKFRRLIHPRKTGYIIGFTAIYIFYFLGVFYSEGRLNNADTRFILQVKASLFLFPLFFATFDWDGFNPGHLKQILIFFVTGCLVSSLIMIVNAVYTYYSTDPSSGVFFYSKLAMHHHPSYLSLIFSFAIAFLLSQMLTNQSPSLRKKILTIILIVYFQVFIALLSSKAGIIGLIFLYAGVVLFAGFKMRHRLVATVSLSVSMAVLFLLLLVLNPTVRLRFQAAEKAMKSDYEMQTDSLESSVARILIWKSALEIISEKPLLGVGTGDVRNELVKKYREKKITPAINNEYNAHNQYLQTYLASGISGLLILFGCLGVAFTVALRTGNLLYFLFTLLFSFHILVESMLERQAGVVFYAFINTLLYYFSIHDLRRSNTKLPQI